MFLPLVQESRSMHGIWRSNMLSLSVPCVFLLWLRIIGRDHKFIPVFSPVACICSFIGFIAAAGLDINKYPLLVLFYATAGTIAGLFIFIRFDDFCHYAFRQQRLTIIALLAASMSAIYSASDMFLWKQICLSTAMTAHWILDTFGMNVHATIDRHISNFPAVSLSSQYFNIQVLQGCSGLEGIFLFLFLLSAIILFDWEFFKNIPFFETYFIGFIYMFLVNTLRIVTLFLIGHLAWMPGASPWMASMRGLPLQVFHSVLGEIYYFIAFVIFATRTM